MRWRCAFLLVLLVTATAAAEPVTLADLLLQMADLSRLSEFPDPPYVTRQFSSYERLSESPGNDNWWANHDRGNMLYSGVLKEKTPFFKQIGKDGKPSGEPLGEFAAGASVGIALNRPAPGNNVWAYATAPDGTPKNGKTPQGFIPQGAITFDPQGHVLAEMDGPGCVVNVWSANPQDAGWMRIYLDHGEKPVIDGKMTDVLGGTWKTEHDGKSWVPFPPPFACETARGYNLYFPIAYQKHCKITVEKPDIYYHVDYRVYPRDTKVETFSLAAYSKLSVAKTLLSVLPKLKDPTKKFLDELKDWTKEQEKNAEKRKAIMDKPGQEFSKKDMEDWLKANLEKRKLARRLDDMIEELSSAPVMDFGDSTQTKTLVKLLDNAKELKDMVDLAAFKDEMRDYSYNLDNALISEAKALAEILKAPPFQAKPSTSLTARPGENTALLDRQGMGVIRLLTLQIKDADKLTAADWRGLVLVGTFDGADRPQIWCPAADFFGSGPSAAPYKSLPFVVDKQGKLSSYWAMPFAKSAKLELLNLNKQPVELTTVIAVNDYKWTQRSMHFHVRWRTATMKTRPFRDFTYSEMKGKGVYVGNSLHLFNPVPAWWGEGDERIYVDGEAFPSWFGTGTEDYYGYAWSSPQLFQHLYHNQPRCDGPGTAGNTCVNRFHVLDAIPFQKSFKFDMEVWHWTAKINVTYSPTSYWYAVPGCQDDFPEVDVKTLQNLPTAPPPFRIPGALEGEKLRILKTSEQFQVEPQDMGGFAGGQWSGNCHLWAWPKGVGSWVELEVPVKEAGAYEVVVYLTKAKDYGITQITVNGQKLGEPIDCYNPEVISSGPISLGKMQLPGPAVMRLETTGTNPRSTGQRYMWGLDCVVLKK